MVLFKLYIVESNCDPNPCQNGGTCVDSGSDFSCRCPSFTSGPNCSLIIAGCWPSPCLNGGICIDVPNSFMCDCPSEYTGVICETRKCVNQQYNSISNCAVKD